MAMWNAWMGFDITDRAREQLDSILKDSHYVGHPMYMENKLVWLLYEDLLRLYDRFAGKPAPTTEQFEKRMVATLRRPALA